MKFRHFILIFFIIINLLFFLYSCDLIFSFIDLQNKDASRLEPGITPPSATELTDVEKFVSLKTIDLTNDVRSLYMIDNYLFAAINKLGIQVLRISTNNNLIPVTIIDTSSDCFALDGNTKFLFAATEKSGLKIFDISNIANASPPVYTILMDTACRGFMYKNNHLFIAQGESGIKIIHIGNLKSIQTTATLDTSGDAYQIYINGNYLFVADFIDGINVINIASLDHPRIIANIPIGNKTQAVTGYNNYLFIADVNNGLKTVYINEENIQNNIFSIKSISSDKCSNIINCGNYLFALIPMLNIRINVFDVNDIINNNSLSDIPPIVTFVPNAIPNAIFIYDKHLYVADGTKIVIYGKPSEI